MQKEVDDVSFLLFESRKEQTESVQKHPEGETSWLDIYSMETETEANKQKRQKIIRGIDRYATLYSHGGDARMEKRPYWSHAWTFYTEWHGYTKVNSDQYIWIRNAINKQARFSARSLLWQICADKDFCSLVFLFQSTRCQNPRQAFPCSWLCDVAVLWSFLFLHLRPFISLSDLNEVVTVSNRRRWSFICTEPTSPPPSSPSPSLSNFTKSTSLLLWPS